LALPLLIAKNTILVSSVSITHKTSGHGQWAKFIQVPTNNIEAKIQREIVSDMRNVVGIFKRYVEEFYLLTQRTILGLD